MLGELRALRKLLSVALSDIDHVVVWSKCYGNVVWAIELLAELYDIHDISFLVSKNICANTTHTLA